ncbi:hypothetical protein RJ55_05128 [Drechmeria coniospora]|nr:hypothetical protein RJ55_05128 [Drechmeria coniospora]
MRLALRLQPISRSKALSFRQPCRHPQQHRRAFQTSPPRLAPQGKGHSYHSINPALAPAPASRARTLAAATGLASLLALLYLSSTPAASLDASAVYKYASDPSPELETPSIADARDPSLPRFRISEVRKHGAGAENPWVIHEDKVYDITDWIPAHPGGQVILRAAGGSIDPYWDIFSIHKSQYVYDILSQYLIGYVDQADLVNGKPAQEQIEDPFADDPVRHPALITKTAKPRNAETPEDALGAQFLTPNDLFYVRNHMWVPKIDEASADAHVLSIELLDGTVRQYTLKELKTKFASHKITAVLQCSGNRRKHMTEGSGRSTNGLQWAAGAISNASWEGVLLSDVLADAGFDIKEGLSGASETKHVHFSGLEAYASSIPIRKAVDPQGDVILAYSMNDEPLPRDHGYPLRALVPGHVAARSVKWLNQITLSDEESTSQWQRKDYKCFGPNETKVDWDAAPAIQEMPVQSAITGVKLRGWRDTPESSASAGIKDGKPTKGAAPVQGISLNGYAFSGGGRSIIRVDISFDGGSSWTQAQLLPDGVGKDGSPSPGQGHGAWSWKRWRFDGDIPMTAFQDQEGSCSPRRCTTVIAKATDDVYNTQPESHAATWNLRGNLATAWHRVQVCADCSPGSRAVTLADDKKP